MRLEARGVSKRYPGVQALDGVDLAAESGEVVAVVGENGAGKSTLMRVLAGAATPDAGEVLLDGQPLPHGSVPEARRRGIVLIHQELALASNLNLAANLWLGREPRRGPFLDRRRMRRTAARALARLGIPHPPDTPLARLSLAERQMVEIARALAHDARFLILDEPTSSLSHRETERLFALVQQLREEGTGILLITHRMDEVEALADRVEILRDGRNAGSLTRGEMDRDRILSLMVGREVREFFRHGRHVRPDSVLEARGLRGRGMSAPVDLELRAGEVLGIAGLVGSGRSELLETLFGLRPREEGELRIRGRPVSTANPARAAAAGMGLVPEDRRRLALLPGGSVGDNLALAALPLWQRAGFLRRALLRSRCRELIARLRIQTPGAEAPVLHLSGGNQQKTVLGRWLAREPRILLLDEPTRGIDVVAKAEIYELLDGLLEEGVAVVLVSSELPELLGLADRILVLHEGRTAGLLEGREATEEQILRLMLSAMEERRTA